MKISVSIKALLSWLRILPLSFLSLPLSFPSVMNLCLAVGLVVGGLWAPSLSLHGGKNHLSLSSQTQPSPLLFLLMVAADTFSPLF